MWNIMEFKIWWQNNTFGRCSNIIQGTSKNSCTHSCKCLSKWDEWRQHTSLYVYKELSTTIQWKTKEATIIMTIQGFKEKQFYTNEAIPRASVTKSVPLRNISANAPYQQVVVKRRKTTFMNNYNTFNCLRFKIKSKQKQVLLEANLNSSPIKKLFSNRASSNDEYKLHDYNQKISTLPSFILFFHF